MEREELIKVVETLLFITDQPIEMKKLCKMVEAEEAAVRDAIAELQKIYLESGRAIQVIEVGGGWQLTTKPEYGRWVRKLYNEKLTLRLSTAALETLAIIAYRQPITRAEIEVIRGVEVIAPLETLVTRGLVKVAGRKETVGRPLLYGTSDEFLRLFGLNNLEGLPKIDTLALEKAQAQAAPQDAPAETSLFNENGDANLVPSEQAADGTAVPSEQPPQEQPVRTGENIAVTDEQPPRPEQTEQSPEQPESGAAIPAEQPEHEALKAQDLAPQADIPQESQQQEIQAESAQEETAQAIEEGENLFETAATQPDSAGTQEDKGN
jgi:segregation and condensation protein B